MEEQIQISFPSQTWKEKQILVGELRSYLRNQLGVEATIQKEKEGTQDLGTLLAIVLGAKTTVVLAKGLSNWLVKHRSIELEIKQGKSVVKAKNLSPKEMELLLKTLHSPK